MSGWFKRFPAVDRAADRFSYWSSTIAVAAAVVSASAAALYSAGAWINTFGVAGWILALVAAVLITALLVGLVAWAYERVLSVRLRSVELINPNASATPERETKAASYEVEIAPILKALQVAVSLEDRFLETKRAVDLLASQQRAFIDEQTKSLNQTRKAVIARQRLDRAEAFFGAIEALYQRMDITKSEANLNDWHTNFHSLQRELNDYWDQFLSDDPLAKDFFLVMPGDLSPGRWRNFDRSKFPDEETLHQYKTIRIWEERIRGYHGRLRQKCEKDMGDLTS